MSTASEEAVKQLRTFMEDGVCVCVFLHVFLAFCFFVPRPPTKSSIFFFSFLCCGNLTVEDESLRESYRVSQITLWS